MSRIGTTPSHCASCFQQDSQLRHVDFEAAYDGPVIPGSPHIAIDDLVLCERCINEAFTLLDPEGQTAEVERLRSQLQGAQAEVRAKDVAIQGLRHATDEILEYGVVKSGGRPDMKALSSQTHKAIGDARSVRRKEQAKRGKNPKRVAAAKRMHAKHKAEQEKAQSLTQT